MMLLYIVAFLCIPLLLSECIRERARKIGVDPTKAVKSNKGNQEHL